MSQFMHIILYAGILLIVHLNTKILSFILHFRPIIFLKKISDFYCVFPFAVRVRQSSNDPVMCLSYSNMSNVYLGL